MALRSQLYWWAECDVCGLSAQDGSEFSALGDKGSATESAENSQWTVLIDGERIVHLCQVHTGRSWEWCANCEDDADGQATITITDEEVVQHCPTCHHVRTLALNTTEQYTANGEDPR